MTHSIPVPLLPNSSFSQALPGLQIAWDSTSLGELKTCPRKYYYSIVLGYQSREENVHLRFGILYHGALERYDRLMFEGTPRDTAIREVVRWLLNATWDKKLRRPWASMDPNKNRVTLVRTVVWYLEQFADDNLETVRLANGKPAVELSFSFQSGFKSPVTGEEFVICGHLDRLARLRLDGKTYIVDRKSTKHTLDGKFFAQFSPHNQFSTYQAGAKVYWQEPIAGLIVDGAQIAVTVSRFLRAPIPKTEDQLHEWYHDAGLWLAQAQIFARISYWPMNDKSCDMWGGCQYRGICAKTPSERQQWLDSTFVRRVWDPLMVRGDV